MQVCFWELVEARMVAQIAAHKGAACALAHHPSLSMMLTGGADGLARVWRPAAWLHQRLSGEDDG